MEYIGGPKLVKEEDAIFTTFHWQDRIGKILLHRNNSEI